MYKGKVKGTNKGGRKDLCKTGVKDFFKGEWRSHVMEDTINSWKTKRE